MNIQEIWKDIDGFEGRYQISNLGRVKSLETVIHYENKNGKRVKFVRKEAIMRTYFSSGYVKVDLYDNWRREKKYIHRLVAIAFIDNPDNKPQINHKNGDRKDFRIENLEWCTQSENTKHAYWVLNCKQRGWKMTARRAIKLNWKSIPADKRSTMEMHISRALYDQYRKEVKLKNPKQFKGVKFVIH